MSIPVGPIMTNQAKLYIERTGDSDALNHLLIGDYVMIIEPRQQGKTSLVYALKCSPALRHTYFAYVDISWLTREPEQVWYEDLCRRILNQLPALAGAIHSVAKNSSEWRDFLSQLGQLAIEQNRKIIIVLDEIGALQFPGAPLFFSVLRGIFNSRGFEPQFQSISFVLEGAFKPGTLIVDPAISPFNIAQRIRLHDFSFEQVNELVQRHGWQGQQAGELSARIHYWTSGQPYLCQVLCGRLKAEATQADVDRAVKELGAEDTIHLPSFRERLRSTLIADPKLYEHLVEIARGDEIKYYPAGNRWQEEFELLGVLKGEGEKQTFCKIRNQIYQQLVYSLLQGLESEKPGVFAASTGKSVTAKDVAAKNAIKVKSNDVPTAELEKRKDKPRVPSKVFLSSTWVDLQPEREAVEKALRRMKETAFVGMEYFGSRPDTPRRVSLAEVDRSDVYIGIFAHRYGSGITEAEYKRAMKRQMRCLIYIKDNEAPILQGFIERDPAKAAKLDKLKKRLEDEHVVAFFSSPEQLATLVVTDLHNLLKPPCE